MARKKAPRNDYDAGRGARVGWLRLPLEDRVEAVLQYHRIQGGRHVGHSQPKLHARLHVTVEQQLVEEVGAVVEFFERFTGDGVVRHEIVHAAMATFAEAMKMAISAGQGDGGELYAERLAALQPGDWLARAVRARVGADRGSKD